MEPFPPTAAPPVRRLLKQTLMSVRWKAALQSTILWKSFMANGTSWTTASSAPSTVATTLSGEDSGRIRVVLIYLRGPAGYHSRVVDAEGQIPQAPGTGTSKLLPQGVQWEELKVFHADQSQGLKSLCCLVTNP
ncbi:hypothetical protein EYF80_029594 [Liparis tanakae]|uniref:Uncharacterized protein n=1 Tax=Liparis tanakae TaxID=230148 RepID=A0A4Z2H3G9_9TELE|nr:hypothetical protein EYF80_029594 [Liparis tanakae]